MKRKIRIVAITICMLISILLPLSSCKSNSSASIVSAEINRKGELVITYSDGTEENLGAVVGDDGKDGEDGKDGKDGEIGSLVVNNDSDGIAAASTRGLRSAVSIVSNFEATVQAGGWYPGSSYITTKEYTSKGSGVIYRANIEDGDAFIITNYHVVYDASSNSEDGISDDISVFLYGSEKEDKAISATYVGGSLYYDIAVLHVDDSEILRASDACGVSISDSDAVSVGDTAIAIGNAQGLGISSTSGIVSVDSEYITMTAADDKTKVSFRVMRVDTAINSGNSGGGLYDSEGKLIGIVNAKIVYEGVENIGYAIPSNVAVSIAENIIDYCYGTDTNMVQRAMLGVTVSATDSRAVYDTSTGLIRIEETVSVYEIGDGSLADGVLEVGDVLVSTTINGKTTDITRQYHAIDMMLDVRVGDVIALNIIRGGEEMTVSITVTKNSLVSY